MSVLSTPAEISATEADKYVNTASLMPKDVVVYLETQSEVHRVNLTQSTLYDVTIFQSKNCSRLAMYYG